MSGRRIELGKRGEALAADFLKNNGYRILFKNYRSKLGEIDIIAKDKDVLCFVEVKTRCSDDYGIPQEAISESKKKQISRLAVSFLKGNSLLGSKARFDVISIIYSRAKPKFDLIKNAFDLDGRYTL